MGDGGLDTYQCCDVAQFFFLLMFQQIRDVSAQCRPKAIGKVTGKVHHIFKFGMFLLLCRQITC